MRPQQFIVAGRVVLVSISPLRRDDGSLRFEVAWRPSKPERLSGDEIREFDRLKRLAITALKASFAGLEESPSAQPQPTARLSGR